MGCCESGRKLLLYLHGRLLLSSQQCKLLLFWLERVRLLDRLLMRLSWPEWALSGGFFLLQQMWPAQSSALPFKKGLVREQPAFGRFTCQQAGMLFSLCVTDTPCHWWAGFFHGLSWVATATFNDQQSTLRDWSTQASFELGCISTRPA